MFRCEASIIFTAYKSVLKIVSQKKRISYVIQFIVVLKYHPRSHLQVIFVVLSDTIINKKIKLRGWGERQSEVILVLINFS